MGIRSGGAMKENGTLRPHSGLDLLRAQAGIQAPNELLQGLKSSSCALAPPGGRGRGPPAEPSRWARPRREGERGDRRGSRSSDPRPQGPGKSLHPPGGGTSPPPPQTPNPGGREPPAPELREREGKPDPRRPRPAPRAAHAWRRRAPQLCLLPGAGPPSLPAPPAPT